MNRLLAHLAGLLLCLTIAAEAPAGSRQHTEVVLPLDQVAALSTEVKKVASENGARVFILARVGRPPEELPEGIEYTHVSFGVYSIVETEDGRKVPDYAIYNLYQDSDSPDSSNLVQDFLIDFLAGAQRPRVGFIIPRPDLQKRLYEVIHSDTYRVLHNPRYSAISNPYNSTYQNCTEHALDVINAAIYRTGDVAQLKMNTRAYFKAKKLKINPLKLMLGSMLQADIKTTDHQGPVETATFETIADYLRSNGLADMVGAVEL